MAGAGYKLFNTGDVLTAAQVNTYLMEQTVMVFANAAARTAALSGVVSEGMISYLKDTNAVEVYDGSNWVSSDDPNAIQNTIVDAKGDLIAASAADTPARLAVGNNGETLVADSSTSTGLRYNPTPAVGRNFAINGAMDIWQRNTTFTVGANTFTYTADRWAAFSSNTSTTVSRDTSVPSSNFRYSLKLQRPNGNTGTNVLYLVQAVESNNAYLFAGQTVTVSFWAKTGANYSGGVLNAGLTTGTAADQGLGAIFGSWTNQADINGNKTISSTWTRYSYSGTVQANTLEAGIFFYYTPSGTAGADDAIYITGVQLEIGSVPTAFGRAGGNIAGELAACMRYFQVIGNSSDAYKNTAIIACESTTVAYGIQVLPVPMRTAPSCSVTGSWIYNDVGTNRTPTVTATSQTGQNEIILITATGTGFTGGRAGRLYSNNDASSKINISAEL